MQYVPPAMRWGKTIQNLRINCFNKWCRIFSNRKINPTQHATGCWWLLLVFYYPRHMPPSVFIHFKAVSIFFSKKLPPNLADFFSMENLNKGSKGWRPASFPELLNGSSSAEGGMPGFLDWRWLSFRDSPSGLGSMGAWEGLLGLCCFMLLGPNPLKETNRRKTTQEKRFSRTCQFQMHRKNMWVCLEIRSTHLKHHKKYVCVIFSSIKHLI